MSRNQAEKRKGVVGMIVRTATIVCILAVFTYASAVAQDVSDIETIGQNMEIAAEEGDLQTAFVNARTIIDAQPEDVTTLSAEQQYWLGQAHMIEMARILDMAKGDLENRQHAAFAAGMSDWILHPHMRTISRGDEVDIEDYLIEGQIVVFDFFSPYCPTFAQIGPTIEGLARQRDEIALVRVNINRPDVEGIDLDSPVAQKYEIEALPYFKIYDAEGNLQAEGEEAEATLIQWLQGPQG